MRNEEQSNTMFCYREGIRLFCQFEIFSLNTRKSAEKFFESNKKNIFLYVLEAGVFGGRGEPSIGCHTGS